VYVHLTQYGLVANSTLHEVCRCIGLSDIGGKVRGSGNPMNVVKAAFEALGMQRRPDVLARMRGKRVVDVERMYYGRALTEIK
jgi:ribosomal protein S5